MPVRKIPRSHRSVTGLVASSKNRRMAGFESSLERDLILLLEFDLNVENYEEQPCLIEFRDKEGVRHTYTPDLLVSYRKDIPPAKFWPNVLYEVKYRKDLFENWKELKPKFRAARRYAKGHGWKFQIITEQEIRTPYLDNVKFLLRYRPIDVEFEEYDFILRKLRDLREADPEALIKACYKDPLNQAKLLPLIWHLVSVKTIQADLSLPLSMHSRIWTVS